MFKFPRPTAFGQLRFGGRLGWARGAAGALFGVLVAAVLGRLLPQAQHWPWIVAPVGASAVLVFAVPASPLAQPWPVFGGNMVAALTGLVAGHVVGTPLLAAGLAVGLAIAAMTYARCLHPPGGACAILGALAATAPGGGWMALLLPLGLNLIALVLSLIHI